MKISLTKVAFVTLFSVPTMFSPVLAWENNWGDNYNYNRGWDNHNYNQSELESVEYNGVIIVYKQIPPRTHICPWVVNRGRPCDGYIGFDERTRTHIFRNDSHQYYPNTNNQWRNRPYHRDRRYHTPTWNGGCVYQNKHVRILCN